MTKTAVVLLNLGGPDSQQAIRPYLYNFFMDRNIIAAPLPVRFALARWISWSRGRGAANSSYRHLGYRSPLLDNSRAQGDALQAVLNAQGGEYKCFIAMRYWHPRSDETARAVKKWGAQRVILLPLYPQYSTTTVKSSFEDWARGAAAAGLDVPTLRRCCYPWNEGFVAASAKNLREKIEAAPKGTRLLFSAHGLPEKIVKGGDPYQWQCEMTAKAIVAALDMPGLDWQICYQSRVGPLKWIGPSTEEALRKAASDGVGVLVYPHAFVSEHVETLVEIDIEYREMAEHMGVPFFGKVDTVGTHPDFIKGLAAEVHAVMHEEACPRKCPPQWTKCPCKGIAQEAAA